jgi:hypothetical protein
MISDDTTVYPLRLRGELDQTLSRWLWLVKWLLSVPHLVILLALNIARFASTVVAGFAVLFTGRYPRGIFDFNVGVMRWSWRVYFYAFGVLGTDKYPPFTLDSREDYPADLHIDYPERLSRGLVVVKWWLLAIPQYVIVAAMTSGGIAFGRNSGGTVPLLGILVLVAALALAFTGRYPSGLFNFAMGINRWVYRVHTYASLMTDQYPPFRLDPGPHETERADR